MTSREQFEAWCTKRRLSTDTDSDCWGQQKYKYDRIQCMWDGWQASREAVEIELPSVTDAADWLVSVDVMESEHVISAIRAAGVKVKD